MVSLLKNILQIAQVAIEDIGTHGFATPGHNGPYHDPETPVRNTGHWLITFSHVFEWTGDEKYRAAAERCAEYLLSRVARPHGYAFHHRNGQKDHCNGLVGQAWTFEALAKASRLFDDPKYTRIAEEVFSQHPFDEKNGLWKRLDIDGEILSFDATFNHQLWFAACAATIKDRRCDEILQRVTRFMDCFDKNLTVLPNGLLYHPIEHLLEKQLIEQLLFKNRALKQMKNLLRALKRFQFPEMLDSENVIRKRLRENQAYKSIGYHAFNMYAFARLKPHTKDHPFWSSVRFEQMIAYMRTNDFRKSLDNNNYGYPYNPPGFEVPYSLFVLERLDRNELIEINKKWVDEQFRRCYNPKTRKMEKNTEDSRTHTARIYELTRLPREILEAVEIELP